MILAELERADYALLISLGSLVASLMALCFQLWSAVRLDRATLDVSVDAMTIVGRGSAPEPVVAVKVVNRGKRPTKLTWLALGLRRGRWSHRRFIPHRWRRNVGVLTPVSITGVQQPAIPQVLDVGGEVSIYYPMELVRERVMSAGFKYCCGTATASTASGVSRLVVASQLGRSGR